MGATKKKSAGGGHARFNALVQGGWLKVLSDAEKSMWMAYQRFANAEGVAYPSATTLAKLIGHAGKSHVGEIRQALERHGLLRVLEVGGGRGKPFKVQLLLPPAAPDPAELKLFEDVEKVPAHGNLSEPVDDDKGSRSGEIKVPEIDRKGSQTGEHYKEELTNRTDQGTDHIPAAAPTGGDQAPSDEGVPAEPKPAKGHPPLPSGVWQRAVDGIFRDYTHAHGVKPVFDGRGWKAWRSLLGDLRGDLDEFAAVVRAALREKPAGRWRGHPPWIIREELNYLRSNIARGVTHVPSRNPATGRNGGAFTGYHRDLPEAQPVNGS